MRRRRGGRRRARPCPGHQHRIAWHHRGRCSAELQFLASLAEKADDVGGGSEGSALRGVERPVGMLACHSPAVRAGVRLFVGDGRAVAVLVRPLDSAAVILAIGSCALELTRRPAPHRSLLHGPRAHDVVPRARRELPPPRAVPHGRRPARPVPHRWLRALLLPRPRAGAVAQGQVQPRPLSARLQARGVAERAAQLQSAGERLPVRLLDHLRRAGAGA